MKGLDLTGYRSGKLVGIELADTNKTDGRYWKCKCDCGNETIIRASRLKNGVIKSCGCLNNNKRQDHSNWRGYGNISHSFYSGLIKQNSRRNKDVKIEVSIEDLSEQFEKQNGKCAYTGLELYFGKTARDEKYNRTASIDRIDSNKHYTKDNIQWVHKIVNIMKNDLTEDEFLNFCKLIVKNKNI